MQQVKVKIGELFSGPGGFAQGAKDLKVKCGNRVFEYEHAWANDVDRSTGETYRRNIFPDTPDKMAIKPVELFVRDIENLEPVNLLTFGFPCNDFSIVGKQKGITGPFGSLYKYAVTFLKEMQPEVFVAENVVGLRSANNGKAMEKILRDLEDSGYDITTNLYKFERYGVPQRRHRFIIVGTHRKKYGGIPYKIPKETHNEHNFVTAKEALTQPYSNELGTVSNTELVRQSEQVVNRLRQIGPGQNVWNAELDEDLKLNVKGAHLSQIYRRLHPDEPSYTVTGSGGGGTHVYHWCEPRALTNRERARLQTFPDDYVFYGSTSEVRRQIGMAVPVLGARVILDGILRSIAKQPYEHQEPTWKTFTLPL